MIKSYIYMWKILLDFIEMKLDLQGLASRWDTHFTALAKSLSTINLLWNKPKNIRRGSKIANSSASLEYITPTFIHRKQKQNPTLEVMKKHAYR